VQRKKRFDLPNLGVGLGLRAVHYPHILSEWPEVDWFEIISENFLDTQGRPLEILDRLSERYPIVMHGVSMSIGSTDPLDWEYLKKLRALRVRSKARWFSDHLCWTGVAGKNTHDLLPLPYTEEALAHLVSRVKQVQDFFEAPLLLENPSSYAEFAGSTMGEHEFLAALAEEADCGLLLDVNNVYVSSYNHGLDADAYLAALPLDRVGQIHVAGHTNNGTYIVDTHIGPVIDEVWALFEKAHKAVGGAATLLEWDAEIPEFAETHAEALKARAFIESSTPVSSTGPSSRRRAS
jgi:uncharacterized protein (UPF0276 family)